VLGDFREFEDGSRLDADLCIIGAGAVGISMAREFIGSGLDVIVLESGGREFEADIQSLYEGENIGMPYDVEAWRLRYFGGTTNHWGGVCGLLDEIDFEARTWLPHSGWPISRSELLPFYEKAQSVCQLAPFLDDSAAWERVESTPLAINPAKLQYGFKQKLAQPVRFGQAYEADLENAENVRVLFHANAVNIQMAENGSRIEYLDLRNLEGKSGRVFARYYVLACGAIENARLLLVSNSVEPAGVGNRHDVVGRFFMEHPDFAAAEVVTDDYEAILMPNKWLEGIQYRPYLKASTDLLAKHGILNAMAEIEVVPKTDSGTRAALSIFESLREGREIRNLGEKVWRVLTDLDVVVANAYRRFVLGRSTVPEFERVELRILMEQAPNPDSRVTLTSDRDALQLNKVRLDWELTDRELRTAKVLTKAVAAEFGRLGLARLKLHESLDGDSPPDIDIGYHQLGTTRMAGNPRNGVVDETCRVHGIDNLYVAGGSVFPSGGYMNPTLTIVALAVRLADHLAERLK